MPRSASGKTIKKTQNNAILILGQINQKGQFHGKNIKIIFLTKKSTNQIVLNFYNLNIKNQFIVGHIFAQKFDIFFNENKICSVNKNFEAFFNTNNFHFGATVLKMNYFLSFQVQITSDKHF